MKLSELFAKEWTNLAVPEGAGDVEVVGLTADSRKVKPGYLFAAFQGVLAHGRDFVAQAVANGAVAVLSENDVAAEPGVPHLIADNARAEFAHAAGRFFPRKPAVRVGVTGTNGKSSTVDFLRQIWAASGKKSASMGTLGAIWADGKIDLGHTTADPVAVHEMLQRLADSGVTHVAMEASSHGLHQHRLDAVGFQAGAFLNLTQDHLDYHATMDEYRAAKMLLWNLMHHRAPAVINADSPEGPEFARVAAERAHIVYHTGWRAPRNLSLKLVEISPRQASQDLTLCWQGEEYQVEVPLIGEFQAINATTAATLALALGDRKEDVFRGMASLKPVKGRMEHVGETPTDGHVFVDYAHTPDGLDVLLRAARPHAPGRIIVVFGCGGDRDVGKRAKMGAIAQRLADIVIVTDDNPRSENPAVIRKQIMEGCPNAEEIGDRAEAIKSAVQRATRGDAVLIAGKGHETGQIIKGVTHPFSDQDVAKDVLERLR